MSQAFLAFNVPTRIDSQGGCGDTNRFPPTADGHLEMPRGSRRCLPLGRLVVCEILRLSGADSHKMDPRRRAQKPQYGSDG
jgi:hypothetical protein